jgi:hypothetical protein
MTNKLKIKLTKRLSLVFIILLAFSCNRPNGIISETIDLNPENQAINEEIDEIKLVLQDRGILIDSIFDSLSIIEKLNYLKRELMTYKPVTDIFNKSNPKSTIVKIDSFYDGCMFFTAYNRYIPNKLVLEYNNGRREVPLNDTTFEYKYKLKPYKLGENICRGYMIQGIDTYGFENRFTAIK